MMSCKPNDAVRRTKNGFWYDAPSYLTQSNSRPEIQLYGGSSYNIIEVGDQEVDRREPAKNRPIPISKLRAGERVQFKITYLSDQANGLGCIAWVDIPGSYEETADLLEGYPAWGVKPPLTNLCSLWAPDVLEKCRLPESL